MEEARLSDGAEAVGADSSIRYQYRDRVIRLLFGHSKENALSLYNAVNHSAYTNADDLEFNTIADAIYMGMKNDFSFLLSTELHLYEHQSTWNPNMPLRGFIYLANLLEGYVQRNHLNIYGSKLQKLPTPHYVVLYNGERDAPDRQTLRLSDAFERPGGCVEMTAEVYNINYGRNTELMARCRPLREYAILVEKIRRYQRAGASMRAAVDQAVEECIREDVLAAFLKVHKAEVIGMLLTEYDAAEHMRMEREESRAEGIAEGMEKGRAEGAVLTLTASIRSVMETLGVKVEAAMDVLKIPAEERAKYAALVRQQGSL